MKTLEIPYGNGRLSFCIQDKNLYQVLSPASLRGVSDEGKEIENALDNPFGTRRLEDMVKSSDTVAIVCDDNTRKTPVRQILPHVLERLHRAGVKDSQIKIIMALGTHRPMTGEEKRDKVGVQIYRRIPVINHNCRDRQELVDMGVSSLGIRVWLNKEVAQADFRIAIGNITPHPAAGWSGGAKIIYPGVAGEDTVDDFHISFATDIENRFGNDDAPLRKDMENLMEKVDLHFLVNTILTREAKIYRVVAGHYVSAHRKGVGYSKEVYSVKSRGKADIVVISSYPKDIEFWQAGIALYIGEMLTRDGGTIVLAAPCPEGISCAYPEFIKYAAEDPDIMLRRLKKGEVIKKNAAAPAIRVAMVRKRFKVYIFSTGLKKEEIEEMGFIPCLNFQRGLDEITGEYGPLCKVTVVTHGGEICPFLN